MKQQSDQRGEMRAEYDIRGGVRGKYYKRYTESRLSIRAAPPGVTVVTSSSTASFGEHPEESTVMLATRPIYQPLEPATR
jgi:hypothetical protein